MYENIICSGSVNIEWEYSDLDAGLIDGKKYGLNIHDLLGYITDVFEYLDIKHPDKQLGKILSNNTHLNDDGMISVDFQTLYKYGFYLEATSSVGFSPITNIAVRPSGICNQLFSLTYNRNNIPETIILSGGCLILLKDYGWWKVEDLKFDQKLVAHIVDDIGHGRVECYNIMDIQSVSVNTDPLLGIVVDTANGVVNFNDLVIQC